MDELDRSDNQGITLTAAATKGHCSNTATATT
jgi:hypothetical protein